jgi:hypothetical protein
MVLADWKFWAEAVTVVEPEVEVVDTGVETKYDPLGIVTDDGNELSQVGEDGLKVTWTGLGVVAGSPLAFRSSIPNPWLAWVIRAKDG